MPNEPSKTDLSHLDSYYLGGNVTPMSRAEADEKHAWEQDYRRRTGTDVPTMWMTVVPSDRFEREKLRADEAELQVTDLNNSLSQARVERDLLVNALRSMMPGRLASEQEYYTNPAYHACVQIAKKALDRINRVRH